MNSWSEKIIQQINESVKDVREKDLRFYRVDEFKRNISRTNQFSDSCPTCAGNTSEILEKASFIKEAIKTPGKKRREYDRLISRLSKHIQKEHKFFPPYYYTYLFSFWGIVSGLLSGFILFKIIADNNYVWVSLCFFVGIIAGYVWGISKDKEIRKSKMLM